MAQDLGPYFDLVPTAKLKALTLDQVYCEQLLPRDNEALLSVSLDAHLTTPFALARLPLPDDHAQSEIAITHTVDRLGRHYGDLHNTSLLQSGSVQFL